MPSTVINLYYLKVNSVSGNGSVNIGDTAHNSHTANSKAQGTNSSFGDTSPTEGIMENILIDPDVNDMASIGTADSTNVFPKPLVPL
ncbi:spore germination protein [Bacillus salacetis]|uniref:Spore germination protein n=1 Tax=Bacillus salacetis TaxID=2315464 RepID=A0A3A1R6H3_9BACI|nr:spore germination protein [Bacillus salacetis]RIW35087.1 spore germination protein [Bacillus salacetis]